MCLSREWYDAKQPNREVVDELPDTRHGIVPGYFKNKLYLWSSLADPSVRLNGRTFIQQTRAHHRTRCQVPELSVVVRERSDFFVS